MDHVLQGQATAQLAAAFGFYESLSTCKGKHMRPLEAMPLIQTTPAWRYRLWQAFKLRSMQILDDKLDLQILHS